MVTLWILQIFCGTGRWAWEGRKSDFHTHFSMSTSRLTLRKISQKLRRYLPPPTILRLSRRSFCYYCTYIILFFILFFIIVSSPILVLPISQWVMHGFLCFGDFVGSGPIYVLFYLLSYCKILINFSARRGAWPP